MRTFYRSPQRLSFIPFFILPVFFIFLLWNANAVEAASTKPMTAQNPGIIKHSDVVFMYDQYKNYKDFGCTVLGWEGKKDKVLIQNAYDNGLRLFAVSIGLLTEVTDMIKFDEEHCLEGSVVNFGGDPFVCPWLWDAKYKNHRAYWWCTNTPYVKNYFSSTMARRMTIGATGLHVDDFRGGAGALAYIGGCFCPHCMNGFTKWLKEKSASDKLIKTQLTEVNVPKLEHFNYKEFLTEKGYNKEKYLKTYKTAPLYSLFAEYQITSAVDFVRDLHAQAKKISGNPNLTLSANDDLTDEHGRSMAPYLTYLCAELQQHHAETLRPTNAPIYSYKLGDGFRRPFTSTASGHDWAFIKVNKKVCLVRSWTALSYAMGHNFMAPAYQWAYTEKLGTHWYTPEKGDFEGVHRFIRENASLFDNYEPIAPTTLIFDNKANRLSKDSDAIVRKISIELVKRNIPFKIEIAGDEFLPQYRIGKKEIGNAQAVILAKQPLMDKEQLKVIESSEKLGRVVRWPDAAKLESLIGTPIKISGGASDKDSIMIFLRQNPTNKFAPIVIHVLNRDYQATTDMMREKKDFYIEINSKVLNNRQFTKAKFYTPDLSKATFEKFGQAEGTHFTTVENLKVEDGKSAVRIKVNKLNEWGIIALE